MSRDRSISALTDEERRLVAAAEQDLDRLLAIEPSPEFAARVRARVKDERPAPSRGRWVPLLAIAASVVVIAGIALMVAAMRRDQAVKQAPVETVAATGHDIPLPATRTDVAPAIVKAGPGSVTPHRGPGVRVLALRSPHPGPRIQEAQVLIDPHSRDAVDRLLAMVREGVKDLPASDSPAVPPARDLVVAPVLIEELEVPLLTAGGGSNGILK